MPTARSTRIPTHGQPVQSPPQPQMAIVPPLEIVGLQGMMPVMVSSLPPMASGNDAYSRQFYRAPGLPSRRYLPIREL
jgi:hypothetical protein